MFDFDTCQPSEGIEPEFVLLDEADVNLDNLLHMMLSRWREAISLTPLFLFPLHRRLRQIACRTSPHLAPQRNVQFLEGTIH